MATNLVTDNINVLDPFGTNGEFRNTPRESTSLFDMSNTTSSVVKYFLMEAYDTAALIWKTWVATGAPDLTGTQYPGPAFPFTVVSVLRAWQSG